MSNAAEQLQEEFLEDGEDQADQEAQDDIRLAFDEAIESESEEDDIKLKMIGAGATFKNVTRLYNQYMINSGLAISKSDRNQIVEDTLQGESFESEDDFNSCVADLIEAIANTTDRSAASLIRAYARKNDLPCYVKPKGEVGTRPGFVNGYHDFLVDNVNATEDEVKDYIMGRNGHAETTDNVKRHISNHLRMYRLVQRAIEVAKAK